MSIATIIALVVLAIIAYVILKVVKSIAKTVFLVSSIVTLIFIVFTILVMVDVKDFRENFSTQPSLFVLDNGKAAFTASFGEQGSVPTALDDAQLSELNKNIENPKLIIGDNYKVFFISRNTFSDLSTITVGEDKISKNDILNIIDSETPLDDYLATVAKDIPESMREQLKEQMKAQTGIEEDSQIKGILFAMMFSTASQERGQIFFVEELKSENIQVYKESILFKLVGLVPKFLISNLMGG